VALRGWAIPAATDIAFAVGVLALVGPRVPAAVRALLLSIAVLDDLGAIVVIALFYSGRLEPRALVLALMVLGLLFMLNRRGVLALGPYLALGVAMWVAVFASGLHATLAGVLLAAFIPGERPEAGSSRSPLERLEEGLHSWVAFGVIPLFALANAGVSLSGVTLSSLRQPVPLGIAAGLVVGKLVGILGGCWLVLGGSWKGLPPTVTPRALVGVAALCGIGFTMSLFVASLAFESDGGTTADIARIGILAGSFVAALLGFFLLRGATAAGPEARLPRGGATP
jgi:NhaA family Na+:H+ antiporter